MDGNGKVDFEEFLVSMAGRRELCDSMEDLSMVRKKFISIMLLKKRKFFINPLFHNVQKWPNILLKSCSVHTARFLKYV